MKLVGPTFGDELAAAGLTNVQFSFKMAGELSCHDSQNRIVKIWKDDAGAVQESRVADTGNHPQLTDAQITAIKTCLTNYNETAQIEDVAGFKSWLRQNMNQEKRNLVRAKYCEFMEDLDKRDWPAFRLGCQYVRDNTPVGTGAAELSAAAWTAFKNAITTYNIPVTLP